MEVEILNKEEARGAIDADYARREYEEASYERIHFEAIHMFEHRSLINEARYQARLKDLLLKEKIALSYWSECEKLFEKEMTKKFAVASNRLDGWSNPWTFGF